MEEEEEDEEEQTHSVCVWASNKHVQYQCIECTYSVRTHNVYTSGM